MKLVLNSGKAYEISSFDNATSHKAVAATKDNAQAQTQTFFSRESHQLAGAAP